MFNALRQIKQHQAKLGRLKLHCIKLLWIILLLSGLSSAYAELPEPVNPQLAPIDQASSVWVIKTATNTVYLVGSIHALRQQDQPLPTVFNQAYADVSTLLFETDIAALESPALQAQIMQKGLFSNGQSLKTVLDDAAYQDVSAILAKQGLSIGMVNGMQPWVIAIMLQLQTLQNLGYAPELGVDQQLFQRATNDAKTTAGLEAPLEAIDALANMPMDTQRQFLKATLVELATAETLMDALNTAWRQGDTDAIHQAMTNNLQGFENLFKAIIDDRNQRWMPGITKALTSQENTMIVVGAGHMPGEQGLLKLLENAGYTMTQLQPQPNNTNAL